MNLRKFILAALFISISCVGATIKIFGTIAFDSLAAFLGALILGPVWGAIIGFLGHLFTSYYSSFPLGLPVHLAISTSMAITLFLFSKVYKFLENKLSLILNYIVTGFVGVVLNGPVSLVISYPFLVKSMPKEAIFPLLIPLIIASVANIVIAIIVHTFIKKAWR